MDNSLTCFGIAEKVDHKNCRLTLGFGSGAVEVAELVQQGRVLRARRPLDGAKPASGEIISAVLRKADFMRGTIEVEFEELSEMEAALGSANILLMVEGLAVNAAEE